MKANHLKSHRINKTCEQTGSEYSRAFQVACFNIGEIEVPSFSAYLLDPEFRVCKDMATTQGSTRSRTPALADEEKE